MLLKVLVAAIHIFPVASQILRLSKPFISCYFVMSSEGLWACCLLLIGYKDGSLLQENLNFLMVNARDYFDLGDLLHLVSISNELYNSVLLASTYLKIIGLKVHYSIGREFFQTTSQTPRLNSCKQKPQEKQGRICKRKPQEKPWEDIYNVCEEGLSAFRIPSSGDAVPTRNWQPTARTTHATIGGNWTGLKRLIHIHISRPGEGNEE